MKKEKLKKQNNGCQQPKTKHQTQSGITLVALVITIIILLILAGIGISLITGGEGIFQKTDITAKEHKKASMIELVESAKTELFIDALVDGTEINLENLIKKIKEISEINEKDYIITDIEKDEVTGTESVTIIDKKTGVVIDIWMDINGNVRVEGTIVDDISKVTKPTITYTLDPAEGYAETVTIKITVTEEKNGVIKVQLPDNTVKTYNNEKTVEIEYPVNENGTYPFTAVGGNGRTTTKYIQVKNAMSAADIEITNLNEGIASKDTVPVKIKYDENVRVGGQTLTNEDRYQYKIGNGEVKTASSAEITIKVEENGTVAAWYYDGTDKYKTATLTINNIDLDDPSTATIVGSNIEQTTFTLTATGADTASRADGTSTSSGIAKYEFFINGSLAETVNTTGGTATFNVTGKTVETAYTCKVRVYDAVGRWKDSAEVTVKTLGYTADYIIANNTETSLYGKYVTNYTPDGVTDVKWRIFHIGKTPNENENNIYLIADHYVPRTELPAAYGTSTLPNAANDTYGLRTAYFTNILSSYSSGTGSIASDNPARNWLSIYWNALNGAERTTNGHRSVAYMMDTRIWNKFNVTDSEGETVAKYVIGGPTLELFVESWNKASGSSTTLTATANATGYYINGSYYVQGLTDSTNLWIPAAQYNANVTGYTEKEAFGMWFASPTQRNVTYLQRVHYNGVIGVNVNNQTYNGFRPIVCLKPNIQLITNDNGDTYQIVGL